MPGLAGIAQTAAGLSLVFAAAFAGETRWARVGEVEGKVEVQMTAADPWQPAVRNLPLAETAWVRTNPSSHVEIELDDGSAIRLTAGTLLELSDYSRLSTGQRITLLSVDRGLAYFTGEAKGKDALILAVPGAQLTIGPGVRVRLEAGETASQIAVIEGKPTFSSPGAELTLHEGQTVKVEAGRSHRFALYREVAPLDTDRWSEQRDKALASSSAAGHLPHLLYGLGDLDEHGTWVTTAEYGTVWKPNAKPDWSPFRSGRWLWYPQLGFVWIAAEPWGWLPYHYGRWMRNESAGWFWAPGKSAIFKPGETYWLRAAGVAGWGPLAPAEVWTATTVPQLYLHAHTTYAKFAPEAREIDPASLPRPRDTLMNATFAAALPSPPMPSARLDATRPVLRAGSTRIVPVLSGITFEQAPAVQPAPAAPAPAPPPVEAAAPEQITTVVPEPPVQETVVVPVPVETPVYYPAPVYTGIVVVNPPEHKRKPEPRRRTSEPPSRRVEAEPPRRVEPAPVRAAEPPARRVERQEVRSEPRRSEERSAPPQPEQPVQRDLPQPREGRRQR
jgi:hypothetical protein